MREPQALLASRRKYEADGWYTCRSLRHKCAVGALSFSKRVLSLSLSLSLSLTHTHTHTYQGTQQAADERALGISTQLIASICVEVQRVQLLFSQRSGVLRERHRAALHMSACVCGERALARAHNAACARATHTAGAARGVVCARSRQSHSSHNATAVTSETD